MIIVNFSHPLAAELLAQIEGLAATTIRQVIDVKTELDVEAPFRVQIATLVNAVGMSSTAWQTEPILIVPPSLNYIAVALLAELHGRMGYFPSCIRLRRRSDTAAPTFEVAELLNLQAIREAARHTR